MTTPTPQPVDDPDIVDGLLAALTQLTPATHPGYHYELTRTPDGHLTGVDVGVLAYDRHHDPVFLHTHIPTTTPPPQAHLERLHAAATHRANQARLRATP